jgi:hypothetical protein
VREVPNIEQEHNTLKHAAWRPAAARDKIELEIHDSRSFTCDLGAARLAPPNRWLRGWRRR